jgi:threonine synthase
MSVDDQRLTTRNAWSGIISRYKAYLPVTDDTPVITLGEGNTPLIKASNLKENAGLDLDIYFKFEGLNPTASFKDRGMTMAISKAVESGAKAVICASTGNTSASAAAYAARAGIKSFVIIPEGKIAFGKLSQALIHNAVVIQTTGNFDTALSIVKDLVKRYPMTLVNSINPYRLEGQKTGAFEVCNQLGSVPDFHVLPVGNAGNITAYWRGYKEYKKAGRIASLPKMLGFQAAGASPIVQGKKVKNPETIATAIRIGNPASWEGAVNARDESGGLIDAVSDEEIVSAYKLIASSEGIFCEPASAATVAGILKLNAKGYFEKGQTLVCTLTGHGLKDPDTAINAVGEPVSVGAELKDVEAIIKQHL